MSKAQSILRCFVFFMCTFDSVCKRRQSTHALFKVLKVVLVMTNQNVLVLF